MQLTSTAFGEGALIPPGYTCDGEDRSPPLAWSDAPASTKAFALIMDDPDAPAGVWVHWVLFDIPASVSALPEGVPSDLRCRRAECTARMAGGASGTAAPAHLEARTATSSSCTRWTRRCHRWATRQRHATWKLRCGDTSSRD
jgi:phosphatidylethanolamine-binding protein (PEBP) family uncharacterized protein